MAAVLAAARGAFPGRRLVLAFQPHRYTRTRDCFEDFVKVLGSADAVLLTEVYAAGEAPIVAADGRTLARALRVAGKVDPVFVDDVDALPAAVLEQARDGDVVIVMGAGSIGLSPAQARRTADGRRRAMSIDGQPSHFGKVAVLMGGSSAEREISLMSGSGVLAALQSQGIDAQAFDPAERDLVELKRDGFARCFIALHGRHGEDGTVQGALELLGIPYTGSGVMASAIAIDKVMTKRVWLAEGLPTPRYVVLGAGAHTPTHMRSVPDTLGLPLIVKPPHEGSSIGVTKVAGLLADAGRGASWRRATTPRCCARSSSTARKSPARCSARATARARCRWCASSRPRAPTTTRTSTSPTTCTYLVPSGLPPAEEAEIQRIVLAAYRALGCRGWGRADLMIRAADRQPFLLEMNTSPGMTGAFAGADVGRAPPASATSSCACDAAGHARARQQPARRTA